jgi:hypothetical protein
MFGRKKEPVLTATYCEEMEGLRQAAEVLTGQRVRIGRIDFNTGRSLLFVGEEMRNTSFYFGRKDLLSFSFWENHYEPREWFTAIFDESREVRVIKDVGNPHKCGSWDMWWIGRSANDRREEPLFLKEAEFCAQQCGLSLEAYLKLEAGEIWPL